MHIPVLLQEAVECLVTDASGCYVDGTFGRGGHSREILSRLSPSGSLLGIDQDPEAIVEAQQLVQSDQRFQIEQANFDALEELLEQRGMNGTLDGLLLDLGVSSPQLDQPERGFSFLNNGPLDMRMNPERGQSAAEWIASADESEIVQVLREYGEERFARRMAAAIVRERDIEPIETTKRLADIVSEANPAWEKGKHPATRAFQGIRIFINRELDVLTSVLEQALRALKPGGRLVVISFHSLEDRIVKRFMRDHSRWVHGITPMHDIPPTLKLIAKKVTAGGEELERNVRSRSAIMRAAEKLEPEVSRG